MKVTTPVRAYLLAVALGLFALVLAIVFALAVRVAVADAEATAPWWHVTIGSRPTDLTPGSERTIVVTATNLGDADANGGAGSPVLLRDVLPVDVKVEKAYFLAGTEDLALPEGEETECSAHAVAGGRQEVVCRYEGALPPYSSLEAYVYVLVEPGALTAGTLTDEAGVSGGGAVPLSNARPLDVSSKPTEFGVETFEVVPENAEGLPETQAGSHPFQLTTTVVLNAGEETRGKEEFEEHEPYFGEVAQPALPKDLKFKLPPGLVGNPTQFPECTEGQFKLMKCPVGSQVGVAVVSVAEPLRRPQAVPVFNMVPATGEPARFGFNDENIPVFIDTSVRTGEDYGVTASVNNITQTGKLLSSQVTLWGWPGDPRHDRSRGYNCVGFYGLFYEIYREFYPELACSSPPDPAGAPFLSLPTSCPANASREPFAVTMEGDSWPGPNKPQKDTSELEYLLHDALDPSIGLDGCNKIGFEPSIKVTPDVPAASSSTGLNIDLHVPQQEVLNPHGPAEADVKETTVMLPPGVAVNPAGAEGLEACAESEIGFEPGKSPPAGSPPGGFVFKEGLPQPFCPDAAKIGTAKITTPLLPNPLEGAVYIATQEENPFKSLIAMYLVAEDPTAGVLVKLPGKVSLCGRTGEVIDGHTCEMVGQLIAIFASPQLPFEDAEFHFFGGERAPLTTPPLCKGEHGEQGYVTNTSIVPWSAENEGEAVHPSSEFDITEGPNRTPCPGGEPFAPSITAGTTSNQAEGYSPFTMTMSREDGNQQLQGVRLNMPPGLLGDISKVTPCEEARANNGTCGPESLIGETTVSVGVGGHPYVVEGGKVYITGPYHGAPYGLSIVNPAKAGPFDLEHTKNHSPACDCLIVRAKIEVNRTTAALTVTANSGSEEDSIPTAIEGIPLQIKDVNVTIDHNEFTFNSGTCNPLSITSTLSSAEGATFSPPAVSYHDTNCAALAFKPTFAASTKAHNTRTGGASLTTTVTYPDTPQGTEDTIGKVKVTLPARLPARLTTLQKACPEATFAANPASCPAASKIGTATTTTPVLPGRLEGPAYFVSHGGAKYPELVIELSGDNVTVDLHGETHIEKSGALTSTFNAIPDAPFSKFELTLPEGPHSVLTANGAKLCKFGALHMPTELTSQDGDVIKQDTKVKITGCPKHKKKHAHSKKKHTKDRKRHNSKKK